jgi:hypothetical protein
MYIHKHKNEFSQMRFTLRNLQELTPETPNLHNDAESLLSANKKSGSLV